jgi:hypothetical protein
MQPINLPALHRPGSRSWSAPAVRLLITLGNSVLYAVSFAAGWLYLVLRWSLIAATVLSETLGARFAAAHGTFWHDVIPAMVLGLLPLAVLLALRTIWSLYTRVNRRRTWAG